MKVLFSHRNFPAQFRHILVELAKDPSNEIVFITGTPNKYAIKGVQKYVYKLKRQIPKNCHRYLRQFEDAVIHGQAAAETAISLRNNGFIPDIIYAHPWGNSMFLKEVFPETPFLTYAEWYYNPKDTDVDFNQKKLSVDTLALIKCRNAHLLLDLESCNKGIAPTYWQKSQIPHVFQHKIEVLHDGIDTDFFSPNTHVCLKIPGTNIELNYKDEVLTYATRGMEPYRGFPQFMEIAEILLKKRPKLQVVIAGEDKVCYGAQLRNTTYKKFMLEKLHLDMTRVHFTGGLPYTEYKKLLQISSVHVYLTYPFVLSWSLLEAMSCGCCIVASNTAPVKEVIKNNDNGILVDFYDINGFVEKIEYLLNNKNETSSLKIAARKTILQNYNLKKCLPQHVKFITNLAKST